MHAIDFRGKAIDDQVTDALEQRWRTVISGHFKTAPLAYIDMSYRLWGPGFVKGGRHIMGDFSSPSYSPQDLAVIKQVLVQICRSHSWPPTSESAMEVGRFLLAKFEDGVTDPAELLQSFEQAKSARMGRAHHE